MVDSLPALLGQYQARTREKMRLRLAMMLVLLDRVVHLARDEPDEMQGEAILDQFAEMFWMALRPEDPEANVRSTAPVPVPSTPRKL
jgi:hypothetical protein